MCQKEQISYTIPMKPSIFTKIISGEIPCYKIYEDERTFAFLNIRAQQPGHVLVVPKAQVDHLEDLEDEDYEALMKTVKKLMIHMRAELGSERIGVRVEGFEIDHAHVHLIPLDGEIDLKSAPYEVSEDELRDMQERLAY